MRIRKTLWSNEAEPVIVIIAVLLLLGTINVFSSSFVKAATDFNNPYYFLLRHVIWLLIGIAVCFICSRIDYHRWRKWLPWFLFLVVASLVAVLFLGNVVNGARRWLSFGGFSFQPAEFAKLLGIFVAANYLAVQVKAGRTIQVWSGPYFLMLIVAGLVELEPDMGTACIVFGVPFLMAFTVGIPWKHLKLLLIAVAILLPGLIVSQPYRLQRVLVTYDPWKDPQGVGYQAVQSMSTIGSGGFWGLGLGTGVSKYEYLPEAHTDFAFAIFAQEHGYIGVFMVILMFFLLMVCCYYIASRAQDFYGQILTIGIMLLIVGQAVGNLFMVSGAFPVVGIPLPFISYGGSSLIVTMASMGILLNICYHGRKSSSSHPEEDESREEETISSPQSANLHLVK